MTGLDFSAAVEQARRLAQRTGADARFAQADVYSAAEVLGRGDPRKEDVPHIYLIATPRTMRAWNSLAELGGRTIMRDGQWMPA